MGTGLPVATGCELQRGLKVLIYLLPSHWKQFYIKVCCGA
jgi:hypothetical protein